MNQDVSDEGFGDFESRAQLSSGRWSRSRPSDTQHDAQLQEQRRALNTRIGSAITLVLSYPAMWNSVNKRGYCNALLNPIIRMSKRARMF